jgi:hypothetical protein
MASELPIHFFTLVLNGEPFIRYHLERFQALKCPWHWHIIEGLAELKHDTAWSLRYGAFIPPDVAREGRSVDGTAEYLDQIARENPGQITLYRTPNGRMWDGKLEMVNAPLANLPAECLLWEVDSDELWTTPQLELLREMFRQHPDRTAAVFYCWYFVAPDLAINRRRRYPEFGWRRAWRYRQGMRWMAHEPPVLGQPVAGTDRYADVTAQRPFTPPELEQAGLVFQHFAYVVEAQLQFKETYYGYKGITAEWRRMRAQKNFPVRLKQYFNWPWVDAGALVDPVEVCGIRPLAHIGADGEWRMETAPLQPYVPPRLEPGTRAQRGILYLTWGDVDVALRRSVRSVQALHPELPIHVQRLPEGATRLDKATMFAASPFEETLYLDADTVVLDRLDFGFEMARRHGIACTISDCPWLRRYHMAGDQVEFDTGVVFFTSKAKGLFEAWQAHVRTTPSALRTLGPQNQVVVVPDRDQAGFSLAVAQGAAPPFVLPMNWNFRPRTQRAWWGPIKVWHDPAEPPESLAQVTRDQAKPEAIIQFLKFN